MCHDTITRWPQAVHRMRPLRCQPPFTRTVIRGDQFRLSLVLRQQEAEGAIPSHGLMAYMT